MVSFFNAVKKYIRQYITMCTYYIIEQLLSILFEWMRKKQKQLFIKKIKHVDFLFLINYMTLTFKIFNRK